MSHEKEMKGYLDAANEDAKLKPLKPNPLAKGEKKIAAVGAKA
jgi:hypothetical protein